MLEERSLYDFVKTLNQSKLQILCMTVEMIILHQEFLKDSVNSESNIVLVLFQIKIKEE